MKHSRIAVFLTTIMTIGILIGINPAKMVYASEMQNESSEDVTIVASGDFGKEGNNLTWELDSEGVLTVSGAGEMGDYRKTKAPWNNYKEDINKLIINEGVTYIGASAFENYTEISGDLIIPESVTGIGLRAFSGCSGFDGNLIIPEGVTNIGDRAFKDCSGFTGDLILPEGVTNIGDSAFSGCSGFTGNLVIPEGLEIIGYRVFYGCSGFDGTLVISEGVTSIEEEAFYDCSGFTGELVLPLGLESIGDWAFSDCHFVGEIKLPEGLETIGEGAFCYYAYGESIQIHIPLSVTEIGEDAFPYTNDLLLVVVKGSHAEEYAKENDILYKCDGQVCVTIKNWYGYVVDKIFVDPGTTIEEPIPSTLRRGYTFLGFYKNGVIFDFNQAITEDIVLFERWKLDLMHSTEIPSVTETTDNFYQTNLIGGGELGNALDSKNTLWSFNQGNTEKISDSVDKYFSRFVYSDDGRTYWANYLILNKNGKLSYYSKNVVTDAYQSTWSYDDVVDYTAGDLYLWNGQSYVLLKSGEIIDSLSGKVICENGAKLLENELCITTDQKLLDLSTGQTIQDNVQYAWYGWFSSEVDEMDDEDDWEIPDSEWEDDGYGYSTKDLFVWGIDQTISYVKCRQYEKGAFDSHTILTLENVEGMVDVNTGEIIDTKSDYVKCKDDTLWNLSAHKQVDRILVEVERLPGGKYAYRDGKEVCYVVNENHELFYVERHDYVLDLENIICLKDDALELIDNSCEEWSVDAAYINTNYEVYNINLDRVVAKNVRYINCYDGREIMYITTGNDLYIANCEYDEERNMMGTVAEETFANSVKIMSDVKSIQVQKDFALITRTDGSIWSYSPTGVSKLLDGEGSSEIDDSEDSKKDDDSEGSKKDDKTKTPLPNEENISVGTVVGLKQKKIQKKSVVIAWDVLSDVTGYEIYRSTYNFGNYQKVGDVNANTYTDTKLKEATLYQYKVRAYKTIDGKTYYGEYSDVTLANTTVKGASVSKLKSATKKTVTLTWKKVKGISGYEVYRAIKKNGKYKKVKTLSSKKTSYTDKKVESKKKYYYKIRTYKKIKGKKVYSSFSKVKSIKVK